MVRGGLASRVDGHGNEMAMRGMRLFWGEEEEIERRLEVWEGIAKGGAAAACPCLIKNVRLHPNGPRTDWMTIVR